jgi:2-polyprenyl-3-methyl-5-hydroxy-6-metoxy-1,4-benzoquinol methylase
VLISFDSGENYVVTLKKSALLSPYIQKKRIEMARHYVKGRVLDFGCGTGALCDFVDPSNYMGVDYREHIYQSAKAKHPDHDFKLQLPEDPGKFDTIFLLAVLEHIQEPRDFLADLCAHLKQVPDASLVLTTPHPSAELVHTVGAALGLFSSHAADDHETLFDSKGLQQLARDLGMQVGTYKRFMLGFNQFAVFLRP